MKPVEHDELSSTCRCDECQGEYLALRGRPDDCLFDGDEQERHYGLRQNRYDGDGITMRRPRT